MTGWDIWDNRKRFFPTFGDETGSDSKMMRPAVLAGLSFFAIQSILVMQL
jgi:hypothetical protein